MPNPAQVKVAKDGPYLVSGNVPLSEEIIVVDKEGEPLSWKKGKSFPQKESYSLCRCGRSGSKPYCDSAHIITKFQGKETASREPYLKQAGTITGANLVLRDAKNLCAGAGFCHRLEGTWNLTEYSEIPKNREAAIQQAGDCPSGRLVTYDKQTSKEIEPNFPPSISITQDPDAGFSGPIWVKGKVPIISSDGKPYEPRNRVTLCRCGQSKNMPFCDSTHMDIRFDDRK
jgi:CDGSH-type Zn-finger protein